MPKACRDGIKGNGNGSWPMALGSRLLAPCCKYKSVQHVVKANCSDKMCSQIKYNLRILKSGQITRSSSSSSSGNNGNILSLPAIAACLEI